MIDSTHDSIDFMMILLEADEPLRMHLDKLLLLAMIL